MENVNKWNAYMDNLQGHGNRCQSTKTIETLKCLLSIMPPDKYHNVLNIGAGEGLETKFLKDLGYNPIGIVRGTDNLKWARDNYKGITFIDCDMHDLPFGEGSFDAVYTDQVFEHSFAPFIVLLEIFSILRDGGLFYLTMPKFEERHTPNNPNTIEAKWISHHHPSMLSPNVFTQMFEKTGFEVIDKNEEIMYFLLKKKGLNCLHSDVQRAVRQRNLL